MRQITEETEIVGKEILRIANNDNYCFLIFTDKTFAVIKGAGWDCNEEDVDVEFDTDTIELNPQKCTNSELANLLEMGIITHGEYLQEKKRREEQRITDAKEQELQLLEKLKAKYPEEAKA
jgi:hypothetical protein